MKAQERTDRMRTRMQKRLALLLALAVAVGMLLSGCGISDGEKPVSSTASAPVSESASDGSASETEGERSSAAVTELYVRFGDAGDPFPLHLYENDTAAAIAGYVGTEDWRLPIYHYDDYENWEVMQYYDIPSRYEIPSDPETVTEEKAGTVYYSEPNRIVLFFGDAEVSGEYTPVGWFDPTGEFVSAVENNPEVEGWGNKLVHISAGE